MMLSIVHLRARCSALYKPVERLIYQALTIKERQRDMNAKRFISYAALLAGVLILNGRLNAAVESDVVGYQTIPLNLGTTLISVPFEELSSDTAGYPIQKINGDFHEHSLLGDKLYVYSPVTSAYVLYKYTADGWIRDNETVATEDCIMPGESVYLVSVLGTQAVNVAGKVISDDAVVLELQTGMNFIANPYPVDVPISSLEGAFSAHTLLADQLFLCNETGSGHVKYVYTNDGWKTEAGHPVTDSDVIPSGSGAIITKFLSSGTLTFRSPLK